MNVRMSAGFQPAGRRGAGTTLLSFLLLLIASSLFAHDMYLRPQPDKKDPNRVALSLILQKDEVVWLENMTANLRVNGPSEQVNLTAPDEGNPYLEFDKPGTYEVGWESNPTFILLEPEVFNKYITLEDYSVAIDSRKATRQEDQPGREIYTRFIKTFIQIGSAVTEHYSEPLGYKIEIVPVQNPYALKIDSDLDVKVLYDGKPLTDHKIFATYEGYSDDPLEYAQVTRTDEQGIARFRINHRGLWLIRTNHMIPLEDKSEADWKTFWANCSFKVE